MKLAVSNIAWEVHDDPVALRSLRERRVEGIEVAPTKVWPGWEGATAASAEQYRRRLSDEGFEVPALQAILFGRPDLRLFDNSSHAAYLEHLTRVADIAAAMGSAVLVLGAPRNRQRGDLPLSDATLRAAAFLVDVADVCAAHGVTLGLEHNPVEYGCDFINRVEEARRLVDLVDRPGLGLHLDSGGMHLCGDDLDQTIRGAGDFVHYHASEPMLRPLDGGVVDHETALRTLASIGYRGWVSIEMNASADTVLLERSVDRLEGCLRGVRNA